MAIKTIPYSFSPPHSLTILVPVLASPLQSLCKLLSTFTSFLRSLVYALVPVPPPPPPPPPPPLLFLFPCCARSPVSTPLPVFSPSPSPITLPCPRPRLRSFAHFHPSDLVTPPEIRHAISSGPYKWNFRMPTSATSDLKKVRRVRNESTGCKTKESQDVLLPLPDIGTHQREFPSRALPV